MWKTVTKDSSFRTTPEWLDEQPKSRTISSPAQYFLNFFDDFLMEQIVDQSNLYAIQVDPSNHLNLTRLELKQFLSIVLNMSIMNLPQTRVYWSLQLGINQMCKCMNRDRFEKIRMYIHFNDNSCMPSPGDKDFDELFKVRPLLDHLKQKFNDIPMSQMLCVGEQLIPIKRMPLLKQYIPGKPQKHGYKVFLLCDSNGIAHDFELYTGHNSPPDDCSDLGASSNAVMKLASTIPRGLNYLLYFDNWSSPVPLALAVELAEWGIYCLSTVREKQLQGCSLASDEELSEKGRGAHDEKEYTSRNVRLRAMKWLDSESVTFLTTFESAEPITSVKRWDKLSKTEVDVPCPKAVHAYDQFARGVDILDSLIGLYRIRLSSKKYYHRIFFHFVDMAAVTSWLLYKRDCDGQDVPKKRQLSLFEFKHAIATKLSKKDESLTALQKEYHAEEARGQNAKVLLERLPRFDNVNHFPIRQQERGQCQFPGCTSTPLMYCHKCEVYLCIEKYKNCFWRFHKQWNHTLNCM